MRGLTTAGLAARNIRNKSARSFGMTMLTAMLCFVLFTGSFLILSLKKGIYSLSDRLGADIIVVPEGYDGKITGAILRGEPNSFFFSREVEKRVAGIKGVEQVSSQLFLASLSASCCSYPLQIIGVDTDTDFVVSPWLSRQIALPLGEGEVIVGHNVEGDYHSHIKFFNRDFMIKGRLVKTGMGFDNSVFMSMEETRKLAVEFEKLLEHPAAGQEDLISSVMVRIAPGESSEEVKKRIDEEFGKEAVYPLISKQMLSEVSGNFKNLLLYVYALIALLWVLALFILAVIYAVSLRERKREFATLRILGATKKKLIAIVSAEVLMINAAGAASGTALGAAVSLLFAPAMAESLKMPFLEPGIKELLGIFLLTLVLGILLGPLSSLAALLKMNKQEPALLLREND